jgi:hypothetical protein
MSRAMDPLDDVPVPEKSKGQSRTSGMAIASMTLGLLSFYLGAGDEDVQRAITYFADQSGAGRMDYASRVAAHEPIGSGVTEAASTEIVKQRLCGSGMKWTEGGAAVVLSLRTLSYTPERWDQFWSKVDRWGFPFAA